MLSSHFFHQLFSIPGLALEKLGQNRLCTNLTAGQMGGLACQIGEASAVVVDSSWSLAELVVRAQSLNLEKLYTLQQALASWISFVRLQAWRPVPDEQDLAVLIEVRLHPDGLPDGTLHRMALSHQLELNLLGERPVLSRPGLLVMDMDSTVIEMECIDEIARLAGVGDEVSQVTELAMQGKLDFAQSLTRRVACLKGADQAIIQQVRDALPLMPGLERLIRVLKSHGWKVAIASGGFTFFADYLKERLSLDAAVSNLLEVQEGKLTGRVSGEIVDAKVKASTLKALAERFSVPLTQTLAMGDGANDLKMMDAAGLGVAYKAKPVVLDQAGAAIRFGGLDEALYLLKP
ncbi:phosphoserine phosphatase SerB [Bowmanella dokdonensis]|uniref:Phosphoserine phosphatase n=2 Tax=Bowmanella dokdonensis TaxID=751969 RepID=A0A939DR72_9ALTE|nr:phosphoserine phosphatase SerB [Bowmanella dokdonensis]MBN7827478.1 phosphoserine phosphatase SerB [Bowmanella dokdonensis]